MMMIAFQLLSGGKVRPFSSRAQCASIRGSARVALLLLAFFSVLQAPAISQETAQELAREKEGKEEKDDPRARQQYIEELRKGGPDGVVPPGARAQALEQMDELVREEGQRYRQTRTRLQGTKSSTELSTEPTQGSTAVQDPSIANASPNSSQWLFIGPRPTTGFIPSSGRVSAIVVDPADSNGNTVYVGGAQGGVWKSVDAGLSWTALMDGPDIPSLAIGSLAIDASTNPSTIYVGTGEQGSAFDSYYGAGVLKSADGGTTWTQLGADKFQGPIPGCSPGTGQFGYSCGGAFIGGLSVRPGGGNPATLLAAVSLSSASVHGSGVYLSTDGGATWTKVRAGSSTLGATSVQYATADIAYAGIDGQGVFRSTNGGATWLAANGSGGSALTPGGRVELSVALNDPSGNTVYASVGGSGSGNTLSGFYRTTDGGTSWTRLGPLGAPSLVDYCTPQCWYDNVVAVNPVNGNMVFAGGSAVEGNISRTLNGLAVSGVTWTEQTSSIHVDHHAAAFTANGNRLYWGNDGGVYRTDNPSASPDVTWVNLNTNLGLTQFYTNFAIHPTDINVAFGGTQDNGTQRYDGALDISQAWLNTGACGDGAGNVIDAYNPNVVYANCQNIDIVKSTNGGFSGFIPAISGISLADESRVLFIPPMVGDNYRLSPNYVYFGTHRVWQTRDQGASWQAISTTTLTSDALSRLAVSPSDRSVMYAATTDGKVWKGTGLTNAPPNDCATTLGCFTEITGDLAPVSRRINALSVSPLNPEVVYVGHGGFGPTNQHISKRTSGSTWIDITSNLPNTPVNDIVVDPDIPGTLYVGTDIGVFISTNDGASWSTLINGLPRVAVYGLKLHRPSRILRAATHGRGFWDLAVPATVTGASGILVPSNLTFAARPLNTTSPAQTMSFFNNGNALTTISSVAVTGEYAITANACTGTLAPSASCNIDVTFTPTSAGLHNSTIKVVSDAVNSPAIGGLTGTAGPPNDNFANAIPVTLGSFTHRVNTLGATVEGTDPTGSCDFSEPPHARSVWYSYRPATSGNAVINTRGTNYDTVLAVFTGSPGNFVQVLNGCDDDIGGVPESPSEVTIAVTGGTTYSVLVSGFVPSDGGELVFNVNGPAPAASLQISPSTLVFPNQAVGTSSVTKTVTLTAVTGAVNTIATAASGDFARTNCPASLNPGQSCTVSVTFTPTATGARNGSLSISSSGLGSPQSVALSGTGDTISLSTSVLQMSAVVGHPTAPQAVTFFNGSGGSVNVTGVSVTGEYSVTHNCSSVLNAATCTINLTFAPLAAGPRNGTLTVTTSAGVRTVTLNGTGVEFSLTLTRPIRPTRGAGTAIVIAPGQSATVELELRTSSDVDDSIVFSCESELKIVACKVARADASAGVRAQQVVVMLTGTTRAVRLVDKPETNSPQMHNEGWVTVTAKGYGTSASVILRVSLSGGKGPTRSQRLSRIP